LSSKRTAVLPSLLSVQFGKSANVLATRSSGAEVEESLLEQPTYSITDAMLINDIPRFVLSFIRGSLF
ncbi:MAG: hypothetical protein UH678_04890, partial [Fibrobacteraceae bacterium]|nr:hypothetical protein [Fibrobacteraceae bacterium]